MNPLCCRKKEDEHEHGTTKKEGKQNLFLFPAGAFNDVHFENLRFWIFCQVVSKICISAIFPVSWNFTFFMMLLTWLIADFSGEIQVDGSK